MIKLCFEIPYGSVFRIKTENFQEENSRKNKRFECLEMSSGKIFLIPNAEVELLKSS
jgi:hypothetical protein